MKRLKRKTSLGYFIPLLLAAWEEQGHSIGVDQHLQLRRLLQSMDDNRPLEEWKTILAPVFSFNEDTQEDFYQLFDQIIAQNNANLAEHNDRLRDIRGQRIKNTLTAPFRLIKENVSNQWWSIKPWGRAAISSLLIMLSKYSAG